MTPNIIHAGPRISDQFISELRTKNKIVESVSKGRVGRVVWRTSVPVGFMLKMNNRHYSAAFNAGHPVHMIERDGKYIIEDIES